jgi:hypothetical protein
MKKGILIILMFTLLSSQSFGFDYSREVINCVVTDAHELGDNGRLNRSIPPKHRDSLWIKFRQWIGFEESSGIYSGAIKTKFSINRQSGAISGSHITNDIWKKSVMDRGSKEQSLKILSMSHGQYLHVMYAQVNLFAEGDKKSFLFVDGSAIYSGTCE